MLYRRFGRTELAMPVFSCGGMRYQYQWQDTGLDQIPPANQENLEATIRQALSLGINHIETARGYGTSEMQLGQILPQFPREQLIVQTKISPKAKAEDFQAEFEQSLAYLQLDYVDLLGLHGINTPELLDYSLRPGGCLDQARQWQREGRVRFIGFSTHAPTNLICQAIQTGEFDYVNLHWYYIFQDNWPAILAAAQQDMGVFIISPNNKGGNLYDPPPRLVDLCAPLSPMVFNDLFCLSYSQVHTLSIGAARPTDFQAHLQALDYLAEPECLPGLLNPIVERLEQRLVEALGSDWLATWQEGLPTPEETPGNINISKILWLRNLVLAYDLVDYGRMRYNLLGNGGHWFPGQPAKNINPEALQDCLRHSPHREIIPQLLQDMDELLGGAAVKRLSQS
ncbi:aldo/keto reductase [Synechocystis sp. LKSZ1]|uniref:aldo/keto reductase n=1 Tax=Synechocystis sp. LKSZ1 TaxID=3144951 RepID=UPI00336C1516